MTGFTSPERRLALERLADDLRPDLHRYAARLMGSVIDGEDVVQDTFARALAAIDDLPIDTPLKPWLFRIAHNRAIDLLRHNRRWPTKPVDAAPLVDISDAEEDTLRREALGLAVSRFATLSVPQRAAVILKDILDEPLAEIAALLDLSLDAVKAHLARGRAQLRIVPLPAVPPPPSAEALHFAALFNRQDWAALRALLANDVRLNGPAAYPQRCGRGRTVLHLLRGLSACACVWNLPGSINGRFTWCLMSTIPSRVFHVHHLGRGEDPGNPRPSLCGLYPERC